MGQQRLVILRGAPASGKSTIAKKFRNFSNKVVWLKVDNFKDLFAEDASAALDYVNGAANATLEYLLDNGFSVIMDGVFQNPEYIQKAVDIAKKKNIPQQVFEIDISLEALLKRDEIREGVPEGLRKPLGEETITKLFNIIKENLFTGAIKLDTEKYSIDECIRIINESFNQ